MASAELRWVHEPEHPSGVVLVMHGGKSRSRMPSRWWNLPVLRMVPFAKAVAEADPDLAVVMLRFAVRGWNGADASPVADAELALEQVAARHPGVPVGLLGYSMGGRTALHLADDERVRAVVALAPWVEAGDRPRGHRGLRLLVLHGTRDRWTSPVASRAMAEAMAARGVDATWRPVEGDTHPMLRRAAFWHRESAAFLAAHVPAALG